MMIDGLNMFYAGLEAKWCALTQLEHRAAAALSVASRASSIHPNILNLVLHGTAVLLACYY